MRYYIAFILTIALLPAFSQSDTSIKALSQADFFALIKQYHPVAKQAELLSDQARARLRAARGGFDPEAYSYVDQKRFKDNEYFHLAEYGLKVPTWFGIEAKAAYEWNSGNLLNPENSLPSDGQGVIGISLPLAQGLFMDERRAALKQAKIFHDANEAQQVVILNDLLLGAAKTYWNWAQAYENYLILENALELAEIRYQGVVESFYQGDKPGIDTLESFILVQDRQVMLLDAGVQLQNNQLLVNNFLWFESGVPLELEPDVIPSRLNELPYETQLPTAMADSVIRRVAEANPLVLQYNLKLKNLDIERRLKLEKIKPKVNVNYNLLTTGTTFPDVQDLPTPYGTENYKFGISASMPLFLRAGRGGLGETRFKINQTGLQLDQKRLEVINKIRAYQNELIGLNEQIVIYEQAVRNYERMLEGEQVKFANGESSIFLINSREVKLMDSRNKLIALKTKYRKALASLAWSMGELPNVTYN